MPKKFTAQVVEAGEPEGAEPESQTVENVAQSRARTSQPDPNQPLRWTQDGTNLVQGEG